MSRVGKLPISVPAGVKVLVNGSKVSVEGPKGKLTHDLSRGVSVKLEDGKVVVSCEGNDLQSRADFGTARALINNMVIGASAGWKKNLELNGVGFAAKAQGQNLILSVGFSHDVILVVPKEIKFVVAKNSIDLESADRQLVGDFAAKIRKVQPPEPYLGKGIKYSSEVVRRKAGKTGKK